LRPWAILLLWIADVSQHNSRVWLLSMLSF
jgi:hypothetical protein